MAFEERRRRARFSVTGPKISAMLRFPNGKTHQAEGAIKHATDKPPYEYGVAFTEETMERIIKESFGAA
jgi:hypothetical protein